MGGKRTWVNSDQLADPVSEVARTLVGELLDDVAVGLRRAAKRYEQDVEYVHQLRVTTRRAGAALKLFMPLLPKRRGKWFRRQLRKIRRAANEARDLDVWQDQLTHHGNLDNKTRRQALARIARLRLRAQQPIEQRFHRLKQAAWKRRTKKLCQSMTWRSDGLEPNLHEYADAEIDRLWRAFLEVAQGDLSDFPQLHQLRIAAKRLRYNMDFLAPAFPKKFRTQLLRTVRRLQNRLGRINDYAVASEKLMQWFYGKRFAEHGLPELCLEMNRQADRAAEEFRCWWTASRIAEFKSQWQAITGSDDDALDQ